MALRTDTGRFDCALVPRCQIVPTSEKPVRLFVHAVITGFGFTLGKTLFEKVRERFMPEDDKKPQEVTVVNIEDVKEGNSD